MLLIRTFISPSAIHGCGVFTADPVKSGTLVWEFNEVIDIEITAEQLSKLPLLAREAALDRSFVNDDGRMILARDNGVFFNHSDDPNTDASPEGNRALRDIEAGEELTEDYRRLGIGGCRSFLDSSPPSASAPAGVSHRLTELLAWGLAAFNKVGPLKELPDDQQERWRWRAERMLEAPAGAPSEEDKLRTALESIALLDEADGHELTREHALRAVAIATSTLGKHPSEIARQRHP